MTYRLQTQGDWTNHVLWAAWSRRSELSSRGWDDVVEVLRRNREAYPWEGRRDAAIFRGAHDQLYAAAGIGSFLANRSADLRVGVAMHQVPCMAGAAGTGRRRAWSGTRTPSAAAGPGCSGWRSTPATVGASIH